jgi:[ribosomal protein S5]-alanine N-acetyltransferase
MPEASVSTARLELRLFTAPAVTALIDRDVATLEKLTGARFPVPLIAPPLMDDALAHIRDQMVKAGNQGWWTWWIVLRETGEAVGSAGVASGEEGTVQLGYSLYREFEGRGFASEAVQALVKWTFGQPGIRKIIATIPPWHPRSMRVAEKAGMKQIGVATDPEVGEVLVYSIERPSQPNAEPV